MREVAARAAAIASVRRLDDNPRVCAAEVAICGRWRFNQRPRQRLLLMQIGNAALRLRGTRCR